MIQKMLSVNGGSPMSSSASNVTFDNTSAKLPNNPDNVQSAIEELATSEYTNEICVGTWNNKKLYRKSISYDFSFASSGVVVVPFTNPYANLIKRVDGTVKFNFGGECVNPVPSNITSSNWYLDLSDISSTQFGLHHGTSWVGQVGTGTVNATFFYTKE